MKQKKSTIYDVAEAAGVSITAVSDVLNGHGKTSPETAAMIRAVITDLGYVPRANRKRSGNKAGNQWQKEAGLPKTTGQVALIIPDPDPAAAHTYHMERISRALAQGLSEFNLDMISVASHPDGNIPYCLGNNQVQGVILRVGIISDQQRAALGKLPCAQFFGVTDLNAPGDQVLIDNESIGRMAAEYLQKQGCDEFTVLSPDDKHASFHLQAQAFDFGARLDGVETRIIEIAEGAELKDVFPSVPASGKHLGIFIAGYNRENEPEMVDKWLSEAGLTEENNVTVIGSSLGGNMSHASIYIAPERIGRHCAEQLVWRMQHPDADRRRIMIEPQLAAKQRGSGSRVPGSALNSTAVEFRQPQSKSHPIFDSQSSHEPRTIK